MKHKKGRPSNYRASLKNNPYWEKVKRKVKIRDGFKCVICLAKAPLEIHHITYLVNGKKIIGHELEHLEWLVTLCESCHTDQHFVPNTPFNPRNPKKVSIKSYKK